MFPQDVTALIWKYKKILDEHEVPEDLHIAFVLFVEKGEKDPSNTGFRDTINAHQLDDAVDAALKQRFKKNRRITIDFTNSTGPS